MNEHKIIANFLQGKPYSRPELEHFVLGYVKGTISDELMTKFLQSIFDQGLSLAKTAELTEIMMNSGKIIDLDDVPGVKVDKHSTGGVGDKVSIIVGPLVASLGGVVAKMSGRGLGFTGGTLDKLESIPGYNITMSQAAFKEQLKTHKIAIIGQTDAIVPADKKMYALRDETNLIASMPLIASSIMSKKLAVGADAILLDVKCGDAAFMKTQQDAETLATWMIKLGQHLHKDVRAEITSMATPLGKMIGNKNEIIESIDFLQGKPVAQDLKDVIYSSATTMLLQTKLFSSPTKARAAIDHHLQSGQAFAKFKAWIQAQGGDVAAALDDHFWAPAHQVEVRAQTTGYMKITAAIIFGKVAMRLGAGRAKKSDPIDYEAGIEIHKKTGAAVAKGDLLFTLASSQPIRPELWAEIHDAYTITKQKFTKQTVLNSL